MKRNIIDYFEETVSKFSDNIAVGDIENEITFNQLKKSAKAVASEIIKYDYEKSPIVILLKRSVKIPIAMLGVLYSNNFYVVLDSDSPFERLKKIVDTLSAKIIIYEKEFIDIANNFKDTTKIDIDYILENGVVLDRLSKVTNKISSVNPAYSIFTSGSTGIPKGALLSHNNVISYIHWFTECFNIDENTVFGSQTPFYFSMSVSDFYACIFKGARYQIIPKEYFAFPAKLIDYLNQKTINAIYWVPSAFGIVCKFDLFRYCLPKYLKTVLFAGEVMPIKYLNYWQDYLKDAQFANLFGPTETTDICTYYKVDRKFDENENLPIGVACDNCNLIIIDENNNQVFDNSIGELYVQSDFVAMGYYANEEKTSQAFVQNPIHNNYLDIVYKTGDLVYKNNFGELMYVGRKDFQIKHLGYRIEPSEIENNLNNVEKVGLCICILDEKQDVLILAYESCEDLSTALKEKSEKMLPHYMQPSKFIRFDNFPKNANGKIDRNQIKNIIISKGE